MNKIVMIDGHSILNRAYFGIPPLTNAQGLHTNAIYGFLNIMFKILDEEKPDGLVVAFDVHAPTFRHEMYKEYKGTRKPMADELREQVPVLKDLLGAMNIKTVEKAGYEADDILGTLSRIYENMGWDVSIISGDRDLLQLATDKIMIRIPKTRMNGTEVENYHAADVMARYNVTPTEFIDMKALMGDSSDNIPGVPGIGEKTASKIISAWHDIDTAREHAAEIKPKKASENIVKFFDQASFSKTLATIRTDCPLDFDPADASLHDMMNETSYELLKKLELKNILKRFDDIPSQEGTACENAQLVDSPDDFCRLKDRLMAAAKGSSLGFQYFKEEDFEGLALTMPEDEEKTPSSPASCFIPVQDGISRDDLADLVSALISLADAAWTDDLKGQLQWLKLTEEDRVYDSMTAAYLLNPLADDYHYDSISQNYLEKTLPSRADLMKKKSLSEEWEEDREKVLSYIGMKVSVPVMASSVLMQRLKEEGMDRLFADIEMPVVYVLHDMEHWGIRVERKELEDYGRRLTGRIDELEQNIYDLAGEIFNINSPKQLGHILFEKMNLPSAKKTKTGYSTSADDLEKLRGRDPIIGMILEYRQLTKLKSTYADGLASFIRPEDQKIHCNFNQTITATGRLSCTDPNLQNIPVREELGRLIRKVFVPEEGKVFINADYSQIELRVLAHMAGDENLIDAYRQDEDIHRITASKVFHVPFDQVTPALRRSAKAVNFGIVYGISSFGLSQDLDISRKEAQEYIRQYFETYPGIKTFLDRCVEEAKEKGFSRTLYGRIRPIPELRSRNFAQRNFGERVAMNSPIQGTAADIIKIAMIKVSRRLKAEKLKAHLILQIHDELLIEAPPQEAEEVKKILNEEMCGATALSVPLVVDMNVGSSWYELK